MTKLLRLVFCNAIVDIKYNLVDQENNPNKETRTMHLEARYNDVVVLGNAQIKKYRAFKMVIEPAVNRLEKEEIKVLVEEGFLVVNKHGNPVSQSNELQNQHGSNVLIGKFIDINDDRNEFTLESFERNGGKDLRDKGFRIDIVEFVDEFIEQLQMRRYNSVVIINNYDIELLENPRPEFVKTVLNFWRRGGGLYLMEENDTFENSLPN